VDVYWLEQTEADLANAGTGVLPGDSVGHDGCVTEWRSEREVAQLSAMRFAKRRADWQLGRWTAKNAVAAYLQLPADFCNFAQIEMRSGPSGAPETFLRNKWAPITISLSHRAGRAVCAVAPSLAALGCDLEVVESHSDAFIADYFATEEQLLVARAASADRPWLVTLLWSAKESALKALHAGLRLDTRGVIVTVVDALPGTNHEREAGVPEEYANNANFAARQPGAVNGWHPLRVRQLGGQTFLGWWQHTGNLVRTVVAAPPPAPPLELSILPSSTPGSSAAGSGQSPAA